MKRKRKHDRWLIFLCACLFMLGVAGTRPLIPLYADSLGAGSMEIGLIVSLFSFFPLLLSIPLGRTIDRKGTRGPLAISMCLGSLSLFVPYIMASLTGVYLSQVIAGLAQLIFAISMQAYAGQFSKAKLRNYYVALFSIGTSSGSFIGPIIGGVISDTADFPYAFLTASVILLLSVPFCLLFPKKTAPNQEELKGQKKRSRASELLRLPALRRAVLVSIAVLWAKDAYTAFFPLLAAEKGLSTAAIGFLVSLNAGAGVLIRLVLPYLSKAARTEALITGSILLSSVILLFHPLVDHVIWLGILSFILGFCLGIGQPLSISTTIAALPAQRVAEGLALRLSFNKLTQLAAPAFLGAVSSVTGLGGVFYVTGIIILGGAIQPRKYTRDIKKKLNG
ncbi:MFS transporter [Bacillus thermotolerans]|uniref:MFS transporter n=1 Tax=Bacillus thermotolerans TaxID=1221996 RepID=UPI00057E3158|nr:MFS transporter [Bacillus thermotolerans]KKB38282.1 putative integral membrane transport protein [Bacillus thermotolerans]KKB44266.1 putative integral membrane transport protein [Bacillus thermotolerans]